MTIHSSLSNLAARLKDNTAFQSALSSADDAANQAEQDAMMARAAWLGAMVESAYIVAAGDGSLSDSERAEIVSGISGMTEGTVAEEEASDMLERVEGAVAEEGQAARFAEISEIVADPEMREAVYLVACAVAWKGGGIGEKQGLALRGLMKAFGFSEGKHQTLLAQAR